jgi:RNA polymerase sigma-70 factor (ECF subfamily)
MFNDILLIRRVREGDIKAFEKLFRKYYTPLLYFSVGITGRRDIAEEIIQDIFYILWRDRERLNIMKSPGSYLYSCVKNSSLQYGRRERLGREYSTSLDTDGNRYDPSADFEIKELEAILTDVLKKMPPRRAEIFRMHRFGNMKYAEIAEKMSLSVKSIEAEMSKAIAELKKELNAGIKKQITDD